jgi:hypothetical protein
MKWYRLAQTAFAAASLVLTVLKALAPILEPLVVLI